MKNKSLKNLKKELQSAGAKNSELNKLLVLARRINDLNTAEIESKDSPISNHRQSVWRKLIPIGLTSIIGLAFGMMLVMLSQAVTPGSFLYPIQKLSDNVAISINPDYRGNIMMKRAQDVKQLVANHASSKLVLATLADYQTEASIYKTAYANYAVFDYCKNNLKQAASQAPIPERQAINKTLSSLQNV